jgi:hypothetical protein
MSDASREFLEKKRAEGSAQKSEVDFTELSSGFNDSLDKGVLDALAKFRPKDKTVLQLEKLDEDEYNIYDYPDQVVFDQWDEDQHGAKHYMVRKLRELGLPEGETAVQEVAHVAEALLHNYGIVNIQMDAIHAGVHRPQSFVPLGINKAIRETLGEL